MKYIELSFKITPYSEDMADVLAAVTAEAGLESFTAMPEGIKGYAGEGKLDEQKLKESLSLFDTMGVTVTFTRQMIEDRNWNEEWERTGFNPVLVAGRVSIHDTGHAGFPQAEYHILIDPRQAFGTGSHQTTGQIIERLLGMDVCGLSVLDAGCGTGILGIFCALKGAASVFAYDIDPWSVSNTKDNIQLNHAGGLQVVEGDASVLEDKEETFDLVLANINRNILLADMPAFAKVMRKGARLVLSGFYTEDIPMLREKAHTLGLTYVDCTEKEGWATLLFQN